LALSRSGEGVLSGASPGQLGETALDRLQAASALAGNVDRQAVAALLALLEDGDPAVRWEASVALGATLVQAHHQARSRSSAWGSRSELTLDELLRTLERDVRGADARRRAGIAAAFGFWHDERASAWLLRSLEDASPPVRASAASALGGLRDDGANGALEKALSDPSVWVRRAAAEALGAIGSPSSVRPLIAALADPDGLVRASAVQALTRIPTSKSRDALVRCTRDADARVRGQAVRGIEEIGHAEALSALEQLLDDEASLGGAPISDMARSAIEAIRERETGLWGLVRRVLGRARARIRARAE